MKSVDDLGAAIVAVFGMPLLAVKGHVVDRLADKELDIKTLHICGSEYYRGPGVVQRTGRQGEVTGVRQRRGIPATPALLLAYTPGQAGVWVLAGVTRRGCNGGPTKRLHASNSYV